MLKDFMSIPAIRESVIRDSIFTCPDDRKSYDHVKKVIQLAALLLGSDEEISAQIAVIDERQRKYFQKDHLSPSALAYLQAQIAKRGFDVESSFVGYVRAEYCFLKPHVYVEVKQLRIKIPKVAKGQLPRPEGTGLGRILQALC